MGDNRFLFRDTAVDRKTDEMQYMFRETKTDRMTE